MEMNRMVSGVTGLRPWGSKASPFNYKRRALPAMLKLVKQSLARTCADFLQH